MVFGIIQRYILGEILRAFVLALTALTAIFVLFIVMAEATRQGLAPHEVLVLVPYIIPGTLPYTMPVSLLFSISVVYGRIASDNEVMAIKAAGVSPLVVLRPALAIGIALSGLLFLAGRDLVPRANHRAKLVLFKNIEEMFYKVLKRDHEFNNARWPFLVTVKEVEGRTLLGATFKHRGAAPNTFDLQVSAKRAEIEFDIKALEARVHFGEDSEIQRSGSNPDVILINDRTLTLPLPKDAASFLPPKRIQELTDREILANQAELRDKIAHERTRQAVAAGMWIATGRIQRVPWWEIQEATTEYNYWIRKLNELETEKHMRVALASGVFFFVLLGAPVGILFAKRDYLSAFMTCFIPIILIYYPLTLAGVNLGKEGILDPMLALWTGNLVLAGLAGFALPPIIRH